MFVLYASEILTKSYGHWSKLHEILIFLPENRVFITISDQELTPFWKTFLQPNFLFNAKLLI